MTTYASAVRQGLIASQRERLADLMSDGGWYTLDHLSIFTGFEPQSISARLRDFRKVEFGGHTVDRRHEGGRVYAYRLRTRGD